MAKIMRNSEDTNLVVGLDDEFKKQLVPQIC